MGRNRGRDIHQTPPSYLPIRRRQGCFLSLLRIDTVASLHPTRVHTKREDEGRQEGWSGAATQALRRRHGGDTAVSIQIAEFNTKCVSYAAIFDDYVIVDRTEGEEKKDSRTFYFSFPNLLLLLPEPSTRHLAAPRKAMAKSERDCLRFWYCFVVIVTVVSWFS